MFQDVMKTSDYDGGINSSHSNANHDTSNNDKDACRGCVTLQQEADGQQKLSYTSGCIFTM